MNKNIAVPALEPRDFEVLIMVGCPASGKVRPIAQRAETAIITFRKYGEKKEKAIKIQCQIDFLSLVATKLIQDERQLRFLPLFRSYSRLFFAFVQKSRRG